MTRPPVDVRQARPEDVEDLLGLWMQARAELGGAGRPLLGSAADLIRPRLLDAVGRRDGLHILLARWEGRPAGFAVVRIGQLMPVLESDCVQLEHLFVTGPLRRHGVARALLSGVATLAERSGADQILSGAPPSAREMHRFLARLGFTPLVLRRVAATATLRRRLAGESRRSGLEDLLSRRRSSRARSARLATPPGGLMLTPPVPGAPADLAPVLDLPAAEAARATDAIDATEPLRGVDVVDLQAAALHDAALHDAALHDAAGPTAASVEACAPEGTIAALVAPRASRRARTRGRTPAAAATGPDVDGPGPAA